MWTNTTLRLSGDPKKISTKTGTPMTVAHAFTDLGGEQGYGFGLVAFNEIATALATYRKGSTLAVTGSLQINNFTNKKGEAVEQLQIVIDGLSGIKKRSPVHQAPREKKKPMSGESYEPAHMNMNQLNDDLPDHF